MFTGKPQKNRGAATTYFDEHLSHNDYYSQDLAVGHQQAGQWIGVGVERLGIKQGEVVTREAFLRLCDNLHPESGKQLTQVTAKDRRIFFDFQCAPPKSVSILAGFGKAASRIGIASRPTWSAPPSCTRL